MIKFEYTFISINFSSVTRPSGFHIALGEEWEDMEFNTVNTNGEYVKSGKYATLDKKWLKKFNNFISNQKHLKSLSTWIYKESPHTTEHRFVIEGESWNTEITLYDLGRLSGHHHKEYMEEEVILLEFFHKVQELFKEVGIDLQYNEIKY